MAFGKGNLTRRHQLVLGLVLVLPLLVTLGKCSFLPTSGFLCRVVSLAEVAQMSTAMEHRLLYVLTVPLGAILVVLCRLTLGIRILGPFRSILLALSFRIAGITLGLVFLIGVVATIASIRPTLKSMKLPYFARVSVILSLVAIIIVVTVIIGSVSGAREIRNVAFFPVFVLCLVGDAFSRILTKEGPRSALWRATMTILIAVLLTWLFRIPALQQLVLNYPELLITQIGCIVLIAEYLDLRLLSWMNPGADDFEESEDPPHPKSGISLAA
ncbi:MAG: hypothetical protein JW888_00175 [Pirellulales bacterium]|nr:hypothetical protein [Pirellulales bacterium]